MIERVTCISVHDTDLRDLGKRFFMDAHLPGVFRFDCFVSGWNAILGQGIGAIWILKQEEKTIGSIGGVTHPDLCTGDPVVQETHWFIHPDHRNGIGAMKLYKSLYNWAESIGARRICMGNVFNESSEKMRKFYLKEGYRPVDVSYFKDL